MGYDFVGLFRLLSGCVAASAHEPLDAERRVSMVKVGPQGLEPWTGRL